MTSHNPAGYYGLEIPDIYQNEIDELTCSALIEVAHEITTAIAKQTEFTSTHLCYGFDGYIENFTIKDKISLLRWITEIILLKFLQQNPPTP